METLDVLVCDDEMGMRMGIGRALRNFTVEVPEIDGGVDFTIREAETGERALEMITAAPPHIFLLDHKLPGISGLDVLDRIGGKTPDMLTIMITAYASIETAVRATKQGAYDFLPKPFTPAELKTTVEKAARHLLVARQARRLAEERRRVRFEFISVVAHELKAPIGAIEGYLNLLTTDAGRSDPKVYDHIIERCTVRISGMRKMITDLLDLTRIESGQKPREIADIDVCDVARSAMETALPDAQTRDITLTLNAPAPARMMADRGEIEIVLNNLISNAIKYNRKGGQVDVSIQPKEQGIEIAVTDTGIGMTKEESAKLFRDFTRIKNEKTKGVLGSGLGLSILKKIAQLYGGDIKVKSEPDKGSTFTVTLRAVPPEAPAA